MNNLENLFKDQLNETIKETNFSFGKKYKGKVRDVYEINDKLLIVTTDRISAFDRVLTTIPFKGQILQALSTFWFEKTADIIENHIIKIINENAILVKKCKILPIEVIIRGYLTGSGWREYEKSGTVSGIKLPKGLKKDCKLEEPIFTPTTKATVGHDEAISREEIIKKGIISEELLNKIEDTAMKLFKRGQEIVKKNNLILVDTKYEFGLLNDGKLIIADEIHTADSSRYWFLDSYEENFKQGKEQKCLDKEFLRQWLLNRGFKGDGDIPEIPFDIKYGVFTRYLEAYETITGKKATFIKKYKSKDIEKEIENFFKDIKNDWDKDSSLKKW